MSDEEFNALVAYCEKKAKWEMGGLRNVIEERSLEIRSNPPPKIKTPTVIEPLAFIDRKTAAKIDRMFRAYFKCSSTASI